jgi:hypothetical protein
VSRQQRKAPKSKPVTQHQLFPAVVALWFGALFGLGSLAVRPSLLEELVIKSRIDLLIPAAAPPLGMTARMVVALAMAALGAMLGTAIARRLARPRQEHRERKRTNLSTRDEGVGAAAFNSYGDASTRNPGPAVDSTGDVAAASYGGLAGRRRSLAIEHEEGDFVPHDSAPLPGGAPQIFDIAASGLHEAPAAVPAPAEPVSPFEPAAAMAAPPAPAPVALDWANAAPLLPPVAQAGMAPLPQAIAAQQQHFQPAPAIAPALVLTEVAAADDRQVFGMVPPATRPADQPRQIFGAPVIDDHVPKEFIESQGFRTSVFEAREPSPLFPARAAEVPAEPAPAAVLAPPPMALPEAFALPVEAVNAAPPVEAVADAAIEASAPTEPVIAAAPEPALPSPASLGMDDLSARLAESMRRRREGRAGTPVAAGAEPAATVEVLAPAPQPEPVPVFTVPPFVVPPFTVPTVAEPAAPVAAPQAIPTAMRPLDLTGFEENDSAASDNLLPQRRIAFPAEPAPALQAFVPPVASAPVEEGPEAIDEAAVAEENYASLLAVTPSPAVLRNPFVRVDEPEAAAAAIEPVVIFPGQAVPPPKPFAVPAAIGVDEATPFRRFDSPSNAGQGQPIAANESASALPPEETERALRSALANLQRMSGAA